MEYTELISIHWRKYGCKINFGAVYLVKAHNHLTSSNAMKFEN